MLSAVVPVRHVDRSDGAVAPAQGGLRSDRAFRRGRERPFRVRARRRRAGRRRRDGHARRRTVAGRPQGKCAAELTPVRTGATRAYPPRSTRRRLGIRGRPRGSGPNGIRKKKTEITCNACDRL